MKLLPVASLGVLPTIQDETAGAPLAAAEGGGGELRDAAAQLPGGNPAGTWWPPAPRLPAASAASLRELRAIRREIGLLARLRHRNIVAFRAACLAPPNVAILQELVQVRTHGAAGGGRCQACQDGARIGWQTWEGAGGSRRVVPHGRIAHA